MTLLSVLGLAVIDSINPSALVVTIYLLTHRSPASRVVAYLATVFVVYLTIGALLMLGTGTLWDTVSAWLESTVAYAVQLVIGGALLVYAILAPSPSESESEAKSPKPRSPHWGAMVLLGRTVTDLEVPTALPYLAAVGVMTTAELPVAEWAVLLVIYNVIFIAPPALLYLIARALGSRVESRLPGISARLQREAKTTWLWILGIVGFFLLSDALSYFEFFGLIET